MNSGVSVYKSEHLESYCPLISRPAGSLVILTYPDEEDETSMFLSETEEHEASTTNGFVFLGLDRGHFYIN